MLASGIPLRDISLLDVQQYLSSLSGSDGSKALATNAIKSLLSFTPELGYTPVNVGKGLKSPKVRDKLANRILSEADVIRMIDRSQGRDRVLLHLLYHAGLRVSEVVSLKWENVHESKDGGILDVWGKGQKQRHIPISRQRYEELNALDGRFSGLTAMCPRVASLKLVPSRWTYAR